MQQLIQTIFNFFYDLYLKVGQFISSTGQGLSSSMTSKIIDGTLISCNFTIQNVLMLYIPLIITLLLIFLVFKVIWNLMTGKYWSKRK